MQKKIRDQRSDHGRRIHGTVFCTYIYSCLSGLHSHFYGHHATDCTDSCRNTAYALFFEG